MTFQYLSKYGYWFNPIQTLHSIQSLSYPNYPDLCIFSKEEFIQNMSLKNSHSLQALKRDFNNFCSEPLKYFLKESSISKFSDCLFDDFVIELFDICLYQISKKSITSRTAREKLAYPNSFDKLNSHINNLFTKAQPTEYWNFFLASNITNNNEKTYSLKLTGSPAIIATIEMKEQLGITPGNSYSSLVLFQNSFLNLVKIINDKANEWRSYLGTTIPNPVELTSYYLEKIWRFNYIDSLINAFSKPNVGILLPTYHSDFKDRPQTTFYPISKLEKTDLEIYSTMLDLLNTNKSNLQTNLFLIQYLFNLNIVTELFGSQLTLLIFFISEVIPLLKESLYYCVFKHCITEEMSGFDLYASIYEYCKSCSSDTLKRHYSIANFQCNTKSFNVEDSENSENYLNMCDLKNSQYKLSPATIHTEILNFNSIFNKCIYSPSIFEDVNSFNQLNANNSDLLKSLD